DPFSFTLDRNKPKGVVLYTALNNGAKVAIQKVDPKGNVVPGATFELYKEGTPDQAEKLVKDKDTAGTYLPLEELDPGSYYLL
ncbi:SpaA isopeptide-forming pilin-related protein, partial [Streptococcus agalactiae]